MWELEVTITFVFSVKKQELLVEGRQRLAQFEMSLKNLLLMLSIKIYEVFSFT